MNKIVEKVTVILFFGVLIFFSISLVFIDKKEFSENENRYLSNFSNVNIENFSNKIEEYGSDHFIFRDNFMMLNTIFKRSLGYFEINNVFFGKNNYLYNKYNYEDLKYLNSNILSLNKLSQKYNINVLLVPSSIITYKDYNFKNIEKELINNIYKKLETNNIDVFDLLNEEDYFKMDHHFNHLGAKKVYSKISNDSNDFNYELVSNDFKGTIYSKAGTFWYDGEEIYKIIGKYTVEKITYDNKEKESIFDDEKLKTKDKYAYYLGGNHGIVNIKSNVNNGKSITLIKDSYANILTPYLIDSYEDITLIDLRYFKNNLDEVLKNKDEIYVFYSLNGFITDINLGGIR